MKYRDNKKKRILRLPATRVILLYVLIALLAPILANNRPIIAKESSGKVSMPIFNHYPLSAHSGFEWALYPPDQDVNGIRTAPFVTTQHILGTDDLGRDVLAMMIHSTRNDLPVAFFAIVLAGFIGLFLGLLSGTGVEFPFYINRASLFAGFIFFLPALFYAFYILPHFMLSFSHHPLIRFLLLPVSALLLFFLIIALPAYLATKILTTSFFTKKIAFNPDPPIQRLMEVTLSIPVLYLLIMLVGINGQQSLLLLIFAIALTSWTGIARLSRAETLRIREEDYFRAGKALGLPVRKILWHHVLPNAAGPALTALTFGIANALLAESFLAFIGLGFPPDVPTLGGLLNAGRQDIEAWWLSFFPGLAIFLLVYSFNVLGEHWQRHVRSGSNTLGKQKKG